jgi:enoyl-CoA hydratase
MPIVRTERDGRVLTVTLDNPPSNLMNRRMVGELDALTRELEADDSVGAVVMTGAPDDVFISHFDVAEILAGAEAGKEATEAGLDLIHGLFLRMNRMDKVFIAAVNGLALGSGCELALACDLRLMAEGEQHRIGLPELSVGIIPGAGGTQRLTRALGPSRALEFMLEAEPLTPQQAVELGLVHRTVASDELSEVARATAERLARRSAVTVGALKRAVYFGGPAGLEEGLAMEREGFHAAVSSAAAARALSAYVEQGAALADITAILPWREGTAVDLTS